MHFCYKCKASKIVIGSSHHLSCSQYNKNIEGLQHGIDHGWFFYPLNYYPIWMINESCENYMDNYFDGINKIIDVMMSPLDNKTVMGQLDSDGIKDFLKKSDDKICKLLSYVVKSIIQDDDKITESFVEKSNQFLSSQCVEWYPNFTIELKNVINTFGNVGNKN